MRQNGIMRLWWPWLVVLLGMLWVCQVQAGTTVPKVTVKLIVTNAQGTVVATMTPQGDVTYTAAYRPYGQQAKGTPQAGPGYTGHVNDPDTGLVYMQQRYYDPDIGRFISPDPVGPAAGNVFNFNRFAYANNSPFRYVDIDGQNPGDLFATPEEAAYDALNFINGTSIKTNHEYMGYIIVKGKQFMATMPVQASEDRGNASMPVGKKVVGDYHTHGHYSFKTKDGKFIITDAAHDNLNSDSFSGLDILRYVSAEKDVGSYYRGYPATPGGHFYVYWNGKIYDLAAIVRQQREQERRAEQRRREEERQKEKERRAHARQQ